MSRSNEQEALRLAELESYEVLDTGAEAAFDRLTRLAADLLRMPTAMITLVDGKRQWFKSRVGTELSETPREIGLCPHLEHLGSVLVVEDARKDPRFCDSPLVKEGRIRFYAGAALRSPRGHFLGALCVTDRLRRTFPPADRRVLTELAVLVVDELELRRRILESARNEARARLAEARLQAAVACMPFGFWIRDRDNRLVVQNEFEKKSWGDHLGMTLAETGLPDDVIAQFEDENQRVWAGEQVRYETELVIGDESRHIEKRLVPVVTDNGIEGILGLSIDITELRERQVAIQQLADLDPLTELPNRRVFQSQLEAAIARSRRTGEPGALLMLDLDRFKITNDTLGHHAGDVLLREIAGRLRRTIRKGDFLSRLGGDEFAIIVGQLDDGGDAVTLLRRIEAAMERPFFYEGKPIHTCFSMGMAFFPNGDETADDVFKNADIALYSAKDAGRGLCHRFRDDMREAIEHRHSMEQQLRAALAGNELVVYYQPVIDLATGAVAYFEALLRWQNPEAGLLAAGHFLPVAEETGLMAAIGRHVIEQVAGQLQAWRRAGLGHGRIAVNVASAQFIDRQLLGDLDDVIRRYDLNVENLAIEVTEDVFLNDENRAVAPTLEMLESWNIPIALDDFGTGFASLTHLRDYPVTAIKIDKSFVTGVAQDRGNAAIVDSILGLARGLGLEVVAEGVETAEELEFLTRHGCNFAQGIYFAPALDPEGATTLLRTQPWIEHDHPLARPGPATAAPARVRALP